MVFNHCHIHIQHTKIQFKGNHIAFSPIINQMLCSLLDFGRWHFFSEAKILHISYHLCMSIMHIVKSGTLGFPKI